MFVRTLFENPLLIFFFEYLLSLVYEFEPGFVVLEGKGALVGLSVGCLKRRIPAIIMGHDVIIL